MSQRSFFKVRLDTQKCVSCGLCKKSCKTDCIDLTRKHIDASRCLGCLDCVEVCPKKALAFAGPNDAVVERGSTIADSRRGFLNAILPGIALAGAVPLNAAAGEMKTTSGSIGKERTSPARQTPITPPGANSLAHFSEHCIGCQLCVNLCPNNVLSSSDYGSGLLQPTLDYKKGYCRPNCNKCGQVCPAGAIEEISLVDKKELRIGLASIDLERCITNRDGLECTACRRICPQKAISLETREGGQPAQPVVDNEKCTGCGACEYVCPSRPISAITVNGFKIHEPAAVKKSWPQSSGAWILTKQHSNI